MKKKLVLVGLLSFTVLFGCTQTTTESKSSLPSGYEVVTEDKDIKGYQSVYTLKNKFSKCFYIMTEGWESVDIEQMMIEKDGVTVPYCEK